MANTCTARYGVDPTVDDLANYVKQYRPILQGRLLVGEYLSQGVRTVDIPKSETLIKPSKSLAAMW